MKRISTLILLMGLMPLIHAQITITQNDMPAIGDTLRVSTTVLLPGIDPAQTGPGFNWDYSNLQPQNQRVERFESITSTPFLYQIIFNQNVANLANPIDAVDFLPGFEISDAYIYYKKNPTNYVRPGYAVTALGIPVPMKFDQPELLYTFPLTITSAKDSSQSNYSLEFPGLGYFSIERKRVNEVDGWGSLTTPFGTFDVLRVKSTVFERDSLYLDSIQSGMPIIRNYIEYQWLGNSQGIPLLTITQEGPATTAVYRDIAQNFNPLVVTGDDQTICKGDSVNVSVSVTGGTPPYTYLWSNGELTPEIRVWPEETTTYGVVVTDSQNAIAVGSVTVEVIPFEKFTFTSDTIVVCAGNSLQIDAGSGYTQVRWFINNVPISQLSEIIIDSTGIGLNTAVLRVEFENNGCSGFAETVLKFEICGGFSENGILKLNLYPNPSKDYIVLSGIEQISDFQISIIDFNGRVISNIKPKLRNGEVVIDIHHLPAGSYLITLKSGSSSISAGFIRQ